MLLPCLLLYHPIKITALVEGENWPSILLSLSFLSLSCFRLFSVKKWRTYLKLNLYLKK